MCGNSRIANEIRRDRREAVVQQAEQVVPTSTGRHHHVAARVMVIVALASLVTVVQACREDEQDRPLVYDKGTYQGQADEKLEQDQIDALRQRAAGQRM
jgi:hypothetical protein